MKLPPTIAPPLVQTQARAGQDNESRELILAAGLLIAMALTLKSDRLQSQLWMAGIAMLLVSMLVLVRHLSRSGRLAIEHLVPPLLGTVAVTGLSTMIDEWWEYGLAALIFGVSIPWLGRLDGKPPRSRPETLVLVGQWGTLALALAGSYLVILALHFPLPLRLGGVLVLSFLATYRSFRVLGTPLPPVKAFYYSLFVTQLIFFFAWGLSYWVYFTEGVFAVLLFLLWYLNANLIRHLEERTFNRNMAAEYGLLGLLFLYLFVFTFQSH